MLSKNSLNKIVVFLIVVSFLSGISFVHADDAHSYRGEIIMPDKNILHAGRGGNVSGSILISNDQLQDIALNVTISIHDFKPDANGDGIDESVTYPYNSSLASWTTISTNQLVINKGETKKVDYTINVPISADYGGKYATISFNRSLPSVNSTDLNIKTRVHHLIFFNVDGNLQPNIDVSKFSPDKNIYLDSNPTINFKTQLLNSGNIHLIPTGYIEISGLFNNDQIQFNPSSSQSEGYIIPDKNILREYLNTWNGKNIRFGQYQAILHLKYGEGANSFEKISLVTFYIFPWQIIIAMFIVAIIFIYLAYRYKLKKIEKKKVKSRKTYSK